jgi:hypothetical protein
MDKSDADYQSASVIGTSDDPFQAFESPIPDLHAIADGYEGVLLQLGSLLDTKANGINLLITDRYRNSPV